MSERPCCRCPLWPDRTEPTCSFSDSLRTGTLSRLRIFDTEPVLPFPDVPALLAHLRASQGDPRTDDIFRDLLEAGAATTRTRRSLFRPRIPLPVIHRTLAPGHGTSSPHSLWKMPTPRSACVPCWQVLRSDEFRVPTDSHRICNRSRREAKPLCLGPSVKAWW